MSNGYTIPPHAEQVRELDALRPMLAVCGVDTQHGPNGPFVIAVLNLRRWEVHTRIALPEWEEFRPASAGHRLMERGWMLPTVVHWWPNRSAGWLMVPGVGWTAPVLPASDADNPAPRCIHATLCCGHLGHIGPCPVPPDDDAAVPGAWLPQDVRDAWEPGPDDGGQAEYAVTHNLDLYDGPHDGDPDWMDPQ